MTEDTVQDLTPLPELDTYPSQLVIRYMTAAAKKGRKGFGSRETRRLIRAGVPHSVVAHSEAVLRNVAAGRTQE